MFSHCRNFVTFFFDTDLKRWTVYIKSFYSTSFLKNLMFSVFLHNDHLKVMFFTISFRLFVFLLLWSVFGPIRVSLLLVVYQRLTYLILFPKTYNKFKQMSIMWNFVFIHSTPNIVYFFILYAVFIVFRDFPSLP